MRRDGKRRAKKPLESFFKAERGRCEVALIRSHNHPVHSTFISEIQILILFFLSVTEIKTIKTWLIIGCHNNLFWNSKILCLKCTLTWFIAYFFSNFVGTLKYLRNMFSCFLKTRMLKTTQSFFLFQRIQHYYFKILKRQLMFSKFHF